MTVTVDICNKSKFKSDNKSEDWCSGNRNGSSLKRI